MKSYREVLLRRVPEGQRSSARALIFGLEINTGHGTMLSALIQKLEGGTPTPTPTPTPTSAFISVSVGSQPGSQQILRITGNGFDGGEQVKLQITTSVDGNVTDTTETTTKADSLTFLEPVETNVGCPVGHNTSFQVQATGLRSSKQAKDGDSC